NDFDNEEDKTFIANIFNSIATVVLTEEVNLNAVTGISGSSPAYFYLFVKSLVDSGMKNGLSYNDALSLVVNTMIGSGKMIINNSDKTLDELINAVCSKGGTTIEAMKVFEKEKISESIDHAVTACIKRAGELENL
ncbi:MAG: pyrroline-5-carboxylate reductase, partial [Clostridia bacterium]|nr:pyrroline-5-carboxylate reductase [Clostridia bacterium]